MAVIPTGAIYNTLTFGGVNSGDYGIYITGEGVYSAPERAVELTAVPGRNGAVPVDLGRWENIEVVYPASTGQNSQVDFRTAVADFRNAVASKLGYQRLEDTYHPDEYRMALFIAGMEVEAEAGGITGEFELRFNCKPQRFLTSGETAVAVANNGTITNPTQLDAAPILQITGYGSMTIGGYSLQLSNIPLGIVQIASGGSSVILGGYGQMIQINGNLLVPGDTITVSGIGMSMAFGSNKITDITQTNIVSDTGDFPLDVFIGYVTSPGQYVAPAPSITQNAPMTFTYGTASTKTRTTKVNFKATDSSTSSIELTLTAQYMPGGDTDAILISYSATVSGYLSAPTSFTIRYDAVMGDSTVPNTGNPAYIDCEIGEAYKIENDQPISINGAMFFGPYLPVLVPGSNTITYDNTITSFEIVPRWWVL